MEWKLVAGPRGLNLSGMIRFVVLSLLGGSLAGAFQIPKGSFDLGQLEEAQKKATAAKQPLAFVIVEKAATPT